MPRTSELENLERRYAENPDGRYFAPLADAYRKLGEIEQAIGLLRGGLEKHPDYLSGYIVLGRCLVDQGDDEGARAAFQQVLSLDAENIIALKALSDIAERGDQVEEAILWLTELLDMDPLNSEARESLERLQAASAAGALAAPSPSALPQAPPETPVEVAEHAGAETDATVGIPAAPEAESTENPAQLEEVETPAGEQPDESRHADAVLDAPVGEAQPTASEAPPHVEEAAGQPAAAEAVPPDSPPPGGTSGVAATSAGEMGGHQRGSPPEGAELLELETYDGTIDFAQASGGKTGDLELEQSQEVDLASGDLQAQEVEGLARTQYESGSFKYGEPPSQSVEAAGSLEEADAGPPAAGPETDAAMAEEPAAEATAQSPAVEEGPVPLAGERESAPQASPGEALAELPVILPEETGGKRAEPTAREPAPAELVEEDERAADQSTLRQAQPVVTETMAELYASQGHVAQARRVYQELLKERPGDADLARKLEALSAPRARPSPGEKTVEQLFRDVVAARVSPERDEEAAPSPTSGAALGSSMEPAPAREAGTGGKVGTEASTLASVFGESHAEASAPAPPAEGAVEASPREPEGGSPPSVKPSARTADSDRLDAPADEASPELSLEQVFADSGEKGSPTAPSEPAEPVASLGDAGSSPAGEVSFDEFFGAERGGGGEGAGSADSDDGTDDLDQFQAWLKGLKS